MTTLMQKYVTRLTGANFCDMKLTGGRLAKVAWTTIAHLRLLHDSTLCIYNMKYVPLIV